jgi:hypothetical protein
VTEKKEKIDYALVIVLGLGFFVVVIFFTLSFLFSKPASSEVVVPPHSSQPKNNLKKEEVKTLELAYLSKILKDLDRAKTLPEALTISAPFFTNEANSVSQGGYILTYWLKDHNIQKEMSNLKRPVLNHTTLEKAERSINKEVNKIVCGKFLLVTKELSNLSIWDGSKYVSLWNNSKVYVGLAVDTNAKTELGNTLQYIVSNPEPSVLIGDSVNFCGVVVGISLFKTEKEILSAVSAAGYFIP